MIDDPLDRLRQNIPAISSLAMSNFDPDSQLNVKDVDPYIWSQYWREAPQLCRRFGCDLRDAIKEDEKDTIGNTGTCLPTHGRPVVTVQCRVAEDWIISS